MRDVIYLSVGDTAVPFRDYEGDTNAYCLGLRDAFRYLGLDAEVSERLLECIEEKPVIVQKVFFLRVAGKRTGEIATMTGIPGRSVRRYAHKDVEDVRQILMEWVRPVPEHVWPN
jgi:DNA-directed RNA polymerase specialized sigma24 family protein